MKKFHFAYQRAMDWRETKAEQAKTELERLHGRRDQLQQSRAQVQTELHELGRAAGEQPEISSSDLHQLASFTRSLHTLHHRLMHEENSCSSAIHQQQEKCMQEDRDLQLLSRLYDSSRQKWNYEAAREMEQLASDAWNAEYVRQRGRTSEVLE